MPSSRIIVRVDIKDEGFTWSFADPNLNENDEQSILCNVPEGHIPDKIKCILDDHELDGKTVYFRIRV